MIMVRPSHSAFKVLSYLFLTLLLSSSIYLNAQTSIDNDLIQKIEAQFVSSFEAIIESDIMTRQDSLIPAFRNDLSGFLKNKETFNYPFEELGKYVKITQVPGVNFRIFGFDELTGGRFHEMCNIIQVKLPNDQTSVSFLNNSNSLSFGNYNDIIVYKIIDWGDEESNSFLLFGWGSNGTGKKFETVRMVEFDGANMIEKENIYFDGALYHNYIFTEAPRSGEIGLTAKPQDNTVSLTLFHETESGWIQTNKPVTFSWDGNVFTRNVSE